MLNMTSFLLSSLNQFFHLFYRIWMVIILTVINHSWTAAKAANTQISDLNLPILPTQESRLSQFQQGHHPSSTFMTEVSFFRNAYGSTPNTQNNEPQLYSSENYIYLAFEKPKNTGTHQSSFFLNTQFFQELNQSKNQQLWVSEFAWDQKINEQQSLIIGRAVPLQNRLDETIHIGALNPYATKNFIDFESQGLTGFNYVQTHSEFKTVIGYYPIYIPNQEPNVSIENHTAVVSNRWAKRPPQSFEFNNQSKTIEYSILDYDVKDIATQPTYLLGFQYQAPSLFTQWGVKRGPLNSITLERETYANLNVVGIVNLKPVTQQTTLAFADLAYQTQQMEYVFSAIYDKPDFERASKADFSRPDYSPLAAYMFKVRYVDGDIQTQDKAHEISLSYTLVDGGEIVDRNFDGTENIFTVTPYRQQFFRPVQLSYQGIFAFKNAHKLKSQLSYLYDQVQLGSLFKIDSEYQFKNNFNFLFGLSILGSEISAQDPSKYFLAVNKSNDYVYSGMSYAF